MAPTQPIASGETRTNALTAAWLAGTRS